MSEYLLLLAAIRVNSNVLEVNMAKVKMGMWMTDASGKSNGHVITSNRQGLAVRTKKTPKNRRTNSQQLSRSRFTTLTQNWSALTQDERNAWDSAASDKKLNNIFGDSYSPTGKNYYTLVNENLLLIGEATTDVPPDIDSPESLLTFTIATLTNAAISLAYTATPSGANTALRIQATRPLSPGVGTGGSAFRDIAVIPAATASPFNAFASYSAVFGAPVTDRKVFFRAIPVSDVSGTRGTPLQVSDIVA